MTRKLEVLFTPAEFQLLPKRDLSQTVCVVFDVLRATSSMVTALGNGAEAVMPVQEISEALAIKAQQPAVLLAGERNGLRIGASLTGGVAFDFGNSPREFTAEKVRGKRIVTTTTNGTRALRSCAHARTVLAGSFLNLQATAGFLEKRIPNELIIVCSGTFEECAYEDVLGAGALCAAMWKNYEDGASDAARFAHVAWGQDRKNLVAAFSRTRNGRRLLERPRLKDDVAFCARRTTARRNNLNSRTWWRFNVRSTPARVRAE
jgi:2-phosphosulfolactate phosphatase